MDKFEFKEIIKQRLLEYVDQPIVLELEELIGGIYGRHELIFLESMKRKEGRKLLNRIIKNFEVGSKFILNPENLSEETLKRLLHYSKDDLFPDLDQYKIVLTCIISQLKNIEHDLLIVQKTSDHLSGGSKKGAKKNDAQRYLSYSIGVILNTYDIEPTNYENGKFSEVLRICFEALNFKIQNPLEYVNKQMWAELKHKDDDNWDGMHFRQIRLIPKD